MYTFVLVLYLGIDREHIEDTMVFDNIENCNYYAREITRRYSTHGIAPEDRAVAYCVPKKTIIK
jgi:hypothetical protein